MHSAHAPYQFDFSFLISSGCSGVLVWQVNIKQCALLVGGRLIAILVELLAPSLFYRMRFRGEYIVQKVFIHICFRHLL